MSSSGGPTDQELADLLARLRPRIVQRLRLRGVPVAAGERIIGEVLTGVAYRWDRLRDHEEWVLETLEKEIRRYLEDPEKESQDG